MLYDKIYNQYSALVPEKRHLLTILILQKRIENHEINEKFSQRDFNEALTEASQQITNIDNPRIDEAMNKLKLFIETLYHDNYKLKLTLYAENFIQLLDKQVNNQYKDYSLQQTFDTIFTIDSEKITTIQAYRQWKNEQFASARETIFHHIQGIKHEVKNAIGNISAHLKNLQHSQDEEFVKTLTQFSSQFTQLGKQADEIKNVLQSKYKVLNELEKITHFFAQKTQYQNITPQDNLQELQQHRMEAEKIETQVDTFLREMDDEITDILHHITYAFERQKEIMDNFQSHSLLQLRIKSTLNFILQNTDRQKNKSQFIWKLPSNFKPVSLGFKDAKFRFLEKYNFDLPQPKNKIEQEIHDEKDIKLAQEKSLLKDKMTEKTSRWTKLIKNELKNLKTGEKLFLHEKFYQIYEQDNYWEIAIKVNSKVLQFAYTNQDKYAIKITPIDPQEIINQEVVIWETIITKI